jgi:predicted RNase H-like HicB family nuclease
MHYTLTVRPEGAEFRAICPQIPGIVGRGDTAGQALDAAVEALTNRLAQRGEPAPTVEVVRATLDQERLRAKG